MIIRALKSMEGKVMQGAVIGMYNRKVVPSTSILHGSEASKINEGMRKKVDAFEISYLWPRKGISARNRVS